MDAEPATISHLRDDLLAAHFTVERLEQLWGADAAAALGRGHRVPARRALDRLESFDAAAVLARVFLLGDAVDGDELACALPTLGLAGARDLGLVDAAGRALLDLRPYAFTDSWGAAEWWIASDLGELVLGHALPEDHVLGVGGASLTLSSLQLQRSFTVALDLGTGCGVQAMHASRHAGRVIATDILPRALELAAFNAALNGVRTIKFRKGDLFEPVRGETFDFLVSNPPFVITPREDGVPIYQYRDGGRVGDGLVAEVIAGVSGVLAPGGVAQLLGNWEYRAGQDGLDRVGEWLDAAGLDGWVVEREVQDPALYAQTWIRDGGTRAGESFDALENAWLADFEARGVTAVGFGYLTLRKPLADAPATARMRRLERLDGPIAPGLAGHIDQTLRAFDRQAALSDFELGRLALRVAPDVTEERHYWPGDEHPAVLNLRQGGGFGRSYPLGTALAAVVGACDGELSVAAICAAVAELLEVDLDVLNAEVLPGIREFLIVGMLTE